MQANDRCRLALWDDEALTGFAERVADAGRRFGLTVDRLPRAECEARLRAGLVEAALLPSVSVLSDPDAWDVYPPAALSAWCAPHASIHLRRGLGDRAETLACSGGFEQEKLMARIVLREHYGMQPELVDMGSGQGAGGSADGVLRVGALGTASVQEKGGVVLDLGQEWFELTAYPMVWGLFVSRAGESEGRVFTSLREAVGTGSADAETVEEMVSDASLRFRFDDVVTASLTELAELLFFYRVTGDLPDLRFAADPDAPVREEGDDPDESGGWG